MVDGIFMVHVSLSIRLVIYKISTVFVTLHAAEALVSLFNLKIEWSVLMSDVRSVSNGSPRAHEQEDLNLNLGFV